MKKRLLFILFVVLSNWLAVRVWGQESLKNIDSQIAELKKKLSTEKSDTNIAKYTYQVANLISGKGGDSKEALDLAHKAVLIAQKTSNYKIQCETYLVLSDIHSRLGDNENSLKYAEQGLAIAEKHYSYHIPALLNAMADTYQTLGQFDKALKISKMALQKVKNRQNSRLKTDLRSKVSYLYSGLHNEKTDTCIILIKENIQDNTIYKDTLAIVFDFHDLSKLFEQTVHKDSVVYYSKKMLQAGKQTGNSNLTMGGYSRVAQAYLHNNQYNSSILYYDSILVVGEQSGDHTRDNGAIKGIGSVYMKTKNYQKAIEYLNKAAKNYEQRQEIIYLAGAYDDIGEAYKRWKKYDKALEYLNKSIELFKYSNVMTNAYAVVFKRGDTYLKIGKFIEAEKDFRAAKNHFLTNNEPDNATSSMLGLATIFLHHPKDSLPIAKKYVALNLQTALRYKALEDIERAAFVAARIDSALGDYKGALAHYKTFALYADSLRNKDNTNLVYEYEAKYDTQKLRAEKAEADKNILSEKADKLRLKFAVAFVLLVVVAVFVAYWLQRKRKNIAQQLQKVAEEIAQTQTLLAEESKALAEANAQRLEQQQRLAQNQEELFAIREARTQQLQKVAEEIAKTQTLLAEESKALAEANAQRLAQEQEIAQNQEELFSIKEARNIELAKERAHFLDTMKQMESYLAKSDYKTIGNIVASQLELINPSNQAQLQAILAEVNENFPQFIPDLIAAHPELANKPTMQDLAVLMAENTQIADIAQLLFKGVEGTAKNNQTNLRNILGFEAGDMAGVRQYLKELMLRSNSKQ